MSKRIKLTAGGAKRVAEWKRYKCPNCKGNFLLHPTRWLPHLKDCTKDLEQTEKSLLYQQTEDEETKNYLAEIVLEVHSSEVVH